jgi:hypothetical protein
MKKMYGLILIFALTLVALPMYAQTNANEFLLDSTTVTQFSYCEIVGTANLLGTKVTVELDFGQKVKFLQDVRYKDPETGKPIKFNSMVDAMNFMGANGWEFVQAYLIGNSQQGYVYHFLLRKFQSNPIN